MKSIPIILLAVMMLCSGCSDAKQWLETQKTKKVNRVAKRYNQRLKEAGVTNFVVSAGSGVWIRRSVRPEPDGFGRTRLSGEAGAELEDLTPLRGMKLDRLNLTSSKVQDLRPIRKMPLWSLRISDSQVTDLSPLKGMDLDWIAFTPKNITNGIDVIRNMPSLVWINGYAPTNFWKRYDAGDFK